MIALSLFNLTQMIERPIVVAKSAMQIELLEQIKRLEAMIIQKAQMGKETFSLEIDMKMVTDKLLNLK